MNYTANMGEVSYTQVQLDAMSHSPGLGFGMFNAIYLATPSRPGNYYMQKIYTLLTGSNSSVYMDAVTAAALKTKLLAYQQRLRALEAGSPMPPIPQTATVIPMPNLQTAAQTIKQDASTAANTVTQAAANTAVAASDWLNGSTTLYGVTVSNKNVLFGLAGLGVILLVMKEMG
jgi:hypothetical protein